MLQFCFVSLSYMIKKNQLSTGFELKTIYGLLCGLMDIVIGSFHPFFDNKSGN